MARPRAAAESEGAASRPRRVRRSLAELRATAGFCVHRRRRRGPRFGPVVDGRFLFEDPAVTFAAGRQNDVPTLTGLNADEGSASPTYGKATAEAFRQQAAQRYGDRTSQFLALYPATSDELARRSQIESGRDLGLAGVQRLLEDRARTARTPSFAYYFDRAIPWPERPEFGAFHTAEVPYVFGTLDALPRPWTDVDRRLSETMMSYWVNFISRGDPNGPGLPTWSAYTASQPTIMGLGERVAPRAPVPAERTTVLIR